MPVMKCVGGPSDGQRVLVPDGQEAVNVIEGRGVMATLPILDSVATMDRSRISIYTVRPIRNAGDTVFFLAPEKMPDIDALRLLVK